MALVGCCVNNVALELLVRQDPSCGPLVTLLQFVVIAAEGLIVHLRVRTGPGGGGFGSGGGGGGRRGVSIALEPRRIPMRHYAAMVAIFWLVSVMNNLALGYQIPMPLHMVFRSGSLVTTIALGYALFRERFHVGEVAGAGMVTTGILLATVASQMASSPPSSSSQLAEAGGGMSEFAVGVFLLTAALVLSSLLGIYQSRVAYAAALPGEGKPYRENMFYSHLLSIPLFAMFAPNLLTHAGLWSASAPLALPCLPFAVPEMWAYLLLNVATQYVCIRGVFLLTGHLSPLGTTVVVTFRKFVSLVISVLLFRNAWSPLHTAGAVLVFSGVLVYTYGSM